MDESYQGSNLTFKIVHYGLQLIFHGLSQKKFGTDQKLDAFTKNCIWNWRKSEDYKETVIFLWGSTIF